MRFSKQQLEICIKKYEEGMTQVIRPPADVIDDALTEATNDLQPEAGRIDLEGVSRSIIVGDGSPAEMIVSEAQNQNADEMAMATQLE